MEKQYGKGLTDRERLSPEVYQHRREYDRANWIVVKIRRDVYGSVQEIADACGMPVGEETRQLLEFALSRATLTKEPVYRYSLSFKKDPKREASNA